MTDPKSGMAFAILCMCAIASPSHEEPVEDGVSADAPSVLDEETLETPPAISTSSSGFSGNLRIRLADTSPRSSTFNDAPPSLRHRPYFSQLGRLSWGDRVEAGWTAVRPVPGPSLAPGDMQRQGVLKGAVELPGRAIIGDYSLCFGQGLLFYDRLGEFVRPDWVQGDGFHPDLSSVPRDQMRGAAVRAEKGPLNATAFFSRQGSPPGGTAGSDSTVESSAQIPEGGEELIGARVEVANESARLAVTEARYRVETPAPQNGTEPVSSGRRAGVWGSDGALRWDDWRLAADAAFSSAEGRRGGARALTAERASGDARVWTAFFDYDADYFAPHAKGPEFDVTQSSASDQRGLSFGVRREEVWGRWEGEAAWVRFPSALGDGTGNAPAFASQARRLRAEGSVRPDPEWKLFLRLQEQVRDQYLLAPGAEARRPATETVRKARFESAWDASPRLGFRVRWDERWERETVSGRRAEGKLLMGELRWHRGDGWSLIGRWYSFQSPTAYLTTGVEEVWDGVVSPQLAGGMGNLRGASGERYVLLGRCRWGRFSAWIKYDSIRRWRGASADGSRHEWRLQTDWAL